MSIKEKALFRLDLRLFSWNLRYLFTINVKKNPLIMFSIGTSVCSSVFAVAKACYSYNSPGSQSCEKSSRPATR